MSGASLLHPCANSAYRHLLHNAINTAASLCLTDGEAASLLLVRISAFLRTTLGDQPPWCTLQAELERVDLYLDIQATRFGGRLRVERDIQAPGDALIPTFALLGLVDNAVSHGVLTRSAGGTVWLVTRSGEAALEVRVEDDGVGWPEDGIPEGKDTFLSRLRQWAQVLDIQPRSGGGTQVRLLLH